MKIYVGWHEGCYGDSGYIVIVGTDKLKLVKQALEKSAMNQNMDLKIYDSETMENLFDCDCLHQYTDHTWCSCVECKDNDETVRYLVETKQGNYHD